MNKFLLSVHVLAAIIFVGPVTVAASMFPPIARRTLLAEAPDTGVLGVLHRISRGYAIGGLTVPVFGIAVAAGLGVLGDYWLIISMVLTLVAAACWRSCHCPVRVLAAGSPARRTDCVPQAKALSMTTGVFALLWAVVVVLMIVRPGSTTGV